MGRAALSWARPGPRVGSAPLLSGLDLAGCSALVLDTVNDAMPEAAELYRSLGFEEIGRFNDNPISGVRFYKLALEH